MSAKTILKKSSLVFLENYLNNASPTGYESEGQKLWMDYLKPYVDTFITDTYGTAVGVINPDAPYKVVIEGHSDEISWYVNYITDNGLIYVIRNGGSDHQIAPSKRVNIHTKKGIVKGVFGWPAIHTRNRGKEETARIDNLFIDLGCSTKEEVEKMGVHVGCVITYPDEFMVLNQNKFVCRAIDNRMGGFMIAEVARLLHENKKKLPFGLYITNSVQEEVGLRGAEMIAHKVLIYGDVNMNILDGSAVWAASAAEVLARAGCDVSFLLKAKPTTHRLRPCQLFLQHHRAIPL